MSTPAWISLGSNLGDRRAILDDALETLADVPGVSVRAVSSYHETSPVGGPAGQGPFLNAAARLESDLDPHQLLSVLQGIENQAGRVRTARWGERTLDLDILIYGTKFLDTRELKLPHPRLALRRFVLAPLAEIAPTIVDTMTKRTIADLLANLDRRPRLVAIDGPRGPRKDEVFGRLVEDLPGFGVSEADLEPPGIESDDDPILAIADDLERKARAFKASQWEDVTLRVPWIVADYFLGPALIEAATARLWKYRSRSEAESLAKSNAQRNWKGRVNVLAETTLPPTFVVVLPKVGATPRRPGGTTPRLWPESDDPDAIVAEVVATCRGIEGV
jgi:2-amino-4-hydroxy-6-hydroxymethyldihydropteridine diphosphokinase